MKNMKTILGAAVLSITMLLASCAKDGAQGPIGPAGTNGTNGNANVKVFFFGPDSLSPTHYFEGHLHLKASAVDSGLVLAYYQQGNGFWYPSPGLGFSGLYQTRFYTSGRVDSVLFLMHIMNPDGTAPTYYESLTKVKVIVAPGSVFGKKDPVDYSNYSATMRYFGLKE
jgi:hypothetical protein